MEIFIQLGGIYCIVFAVFHLLFWQIFDWKKDLRTLTFINRGIMQVLNLSLTLIFLIFGYISLVHTSEILSTTLGTSLLALIALFWMARAIEQVIFFKLKHWGSVLFLIVFILGSSLYGLPLISSF